jgi:hypothetical protein
MLDLLQRAAIAARTRHGRKHCTVIPSAAWLHTHPFVCVARHVHVGDGLHAAGNGWHEYEIPDTPPSGSAGPPLASTQYWV